MKFNKNESIGSGDLELSRNVRVNLMTLNYNIGCKAIY